MSTLEAGTVQRSITVDASQEHAFVVFTREMTSWWPIDSHHIGEKDMERAVMEEKAGGRWFERAGDGTECEWGRVLEWEPPDRVVLAWHLTADWQYDPNPAASYPSSRSSVARRSAISSPSRQADHSPSSSGRLHAGMALRARVSRATNSSSASC